MKILNEFKEFAVKGNMVDMAIGIVIGGAFGTIVKSLVDDIIMPPLGMLTGGIDFADKVWTLRAASEGIEAVTVNYGLFFNSLLAFLVVAWALFFVVKQMNRFKREGPALEPTTKKCAHCVSTIHIDASRCPNCTADIKA